ncbi:MAG: tRNA lysidine(34) synthetase TilS [Candidatus Omnitrophica bacterium]|nr:tRNA lysidine(34) synthetase TilS [Candidatus Omnitrophota bacterium]
MPLLSEFEITLQERSLVTPGDKIFVACSGGPDSVALLFLLYSITARWNLKLGVLHFNHGIRGKEAQRDEVFVRKLAKTLHLPVTIQRGKVSSRQKGVNLSLEERAREARYDFLIRAAKKNRVTTIALAHTLDDQAETVMMRILQGTGLKGLLGVREIMRQGGITFVRPLLCFTKTQILDYLKSHQIPFRIDESNASLSFLRNRIRLKLIPRLIKEFNPRIREALARIPAIVQEENRMLEELEKAAWKRSFRRVSKKKLYLDRKSFSKFPSPLQFRVIDRALKKVHARSGLNFEAWQRLRKNLGLGRYRCSLPRNVDFTLTPSHVILYRKGSRS